jgi:acetoin utilization deacetylase AcuC-like enzyme
MRVTEAGFGAMTERLAEVAGDFCGGKAIFTLEGGYDLQALAGSVKRVLEVLLEK